MIELSSGRVLIKPIEKKKDSQFIMPDKVENFGEIVAIGIFPSGYTGPMFEVGDEVHFDNYGKEEFKMDGEELVLTRLEHLIGKLTK